MSVCKATRAKTSNVGSSLPAMQDTSEHQQLPLQAPGEHGTGGGGRRPWRMRLLLGCRLLLRLLDEGVAQRVLGAEPLVGVQVHAALQQVRQLPHLAPLALAARQQRAKVLLDRRVPDQPPHLRTMRWQEMSKHSSPRSQQAC